MRNRINRPRNVQVCHVLKIVHYKEGRPQTFVPEVHWHRHWKDYCQGDVHKQEVAEIHKSQ